MEQSTPSQSKLHVAIIMDGNGRWAESRGLPRMAGHRAGADAVRRTVEAASGLGIGTLTLFAFSADNWQRPADEVASLMGLFDAYLHAEAERCRENDIRLEVIGRRDRLVPGLIQTVESVERLTAKGRELCLRIAVDYSARDAILQAAREAAATHCRETFSRLLSPCDVDLLIRTGGEQRLSDFLLWESAYAELLFTRRMWPEFSVEDLRAAVAEFRSRERRFGRIPATARTRRGDGTEARLN